ncbi:MAG: LysM peptidoglycan-binding domain-containing protein [Gelidibacter sp.]
MKKLFLIIIITLSFSLAAQAQKFKKHTVKQGETVESIAKQYLVTPFDIYALNPDAKKKLTPNTVLIIPISKVSENGESSTTKELIEYKTHKVKRKETLYSIAKAYNIEIEDIKKSNKQLYSENLKKGDKIRIPRYKTIISKVSPTNTIKTYKVLPKEGKWRVAYKFGITVDELQTLNPNMNEVLQPGDEINVPNIETTEEKPVDANYNYYTVLPKEGFYRLKVKLGLTQEQLETLNPELKDEGLKEGMVLKVPFDVKVGMAEGDVETTNLTKKLENLKTKRIAVMLPFQLQKIDTDSIEETKDLMRTNKKLSVSLDFQSGVLMALDSAKRLGISVNLKVFDTQDQSSEISKILDDNDFSDYDAIIGPLMPKHFDRVASQLKRDNVPMLSPITEPENLYANVFQTIPSDALMETSIIQYVKADSLKRNVVVIADLSNKNVSNRLKSEFPAAKQVFSRTNKKTGKDAYYILTTDLQDVFRAGKNYVFLETANEALVSNVTSMLNGLIDKDHEIILVTTNKTNAFDGVNVSNYHLANLKLHYPSVNKIYNSDQPDSFVKNYKKIYGVEPNKFAVRGFDLMLDVLLRLASNDNLYDASSNDVETEYTENKFRYAKKLFGGYYNEAVYIVNYNQDLIIEESKL